MAMFDRRKGDGRSAPPPAPASAATASPAAPVERVAMIGRGIRVSGDVAADTHVKIDGVVEGRRVQSSHDIEIGEPGKVVGNISAKVVKIAGEVTGDVTASEKVMISKTGRVQGNIVAPRVQLEDGALFRGSIDMNPVLPAEAKPAPGLEGRTEARPVAGKGPVLEASARKEPELTLKSG